VEASEVQVRVVVGTAVPAAIVVAAPAATVAGVVEATAEEAVVAVTDQELQLIQRKRRNGTILMAVILAFSVFGLAASFLL
jgi:hypothetical protein